MSKTARRQRQASHQFAPPFHDAIPAPIYFRFAQMPADAAYPMHRYRWGEFVVAFSGVMEVVLEQQYFLAPPPYGIWLPPEVEHVGANRLPAEHGSLYVAPELCATLPKMPCALTIGPLLRALFDALRADATAGDRTTAVAASPERHRLLQVLVDQLAVASCAGSYLPSSDDPQLGPVLRALAANPADSRSLQQLAADAHTTERTLMRRCQRDLGMPFGEWRQRAKVVRALALLEAGQSVESIGLDLGYSSASAFISMFRKLMGATPNRYRRCPGAVAPRFDARRSTR